MVIRTEYDNVGTHEGVFLYGHWSGYDLPETLRRALDSPAGRNRWDDGAYLARIVFDVMTGLRGGETGFGIDTRPPDGEYDLLVLRPATQRIACLGLSEYQEHGFAGLDAAPSISFADYVAAPERTWENLTDEAVPA